MAIHTILGGKVRLYQRGTAVWHCSTFLKGKEHRKTTREDSLEHAKQIAEDWYLELRGKARAGLLSNEKTFQHASDQFLKEYAIITQGQRSPLWVKGHEIRLRLHLLPFLGKTAVSQVTAGKVQEYRMHRMSSSGGGKAPARSTLHDEIVTLRLVLKTAIRHGWLGHLPDLSPPYRTQGKLTHRPWFSPEEYKLLYKATGDYAKSAPARHRWNAEQVHDFVLLLANTGIRPDEAKNLQHRDVSIVKDEDTGSRILLIEVRGKRGVGYCKSMPGAVLPYERLRDRLKPLTRREARELERSEQPANAEQRKPGSSDPVFPGNHIKLFNGVLRRADLKLDRDGNARTAYSLRHTYISMRLMDRADIYQVAKNCRTSVEMIEKHYAAHIRTSLDAGAINVRKLKRPPKRRSRPANTNHGEHARGNKRTPTYARAT